MSLFFAAAISGVACSSGDEESVNNAESDPLYRYQWHLKNTGQAALSDIPPKPGIDLNMGTLYEQGITGKGVVVGLIEGGQAYSDHEDLQPNMLRRATDSAATTHATATSSIIAAVAGNGKGGRGVAPEARILDLSAPGSEFPAKLRLISNSAGGQPPLFPPGFDDESSDAALNDPFAPLNIHAAGNSFLAFEAETDAFCEKETQRSGVGCIVANTDTLSGLPTTIAVGAVNAAGEKSSYSSTGSVLWISGLGGESGWQREYMSKRGPIPEKAQQHPERYFAPAVVTADAPGCDKGLNKNGSSYNALDSGEHSLIDSSCNYTALANGTSSAAPMVAGVIALMLQVNPKLSWRDIKYVLAATARKIDTDRPDIRWNGMVLDSGWVRNAAGHQFSNWYGFGLVDATRAVEMARHFVALPSLQISDWQSYAGAPLPIPYRRDDKGFSGIKIDDDVKTETVQLQLQTTSKVPGNLRIALVSPSGTRSIILPALTFLIPTPAGFSIDFTASNAFLDERSKGEWKLQIVDMLDPSSETNQLLTSWKLRILGHKAN